MVSHGKLINTPYKGLDSYYVVVTQSVEDICWEDTSFQRIVLQLSLIHSLSSLNISAETSKTDNSKYKNSSWYSSQASLEQASLEQAVEMKAYFMNKILELKNEICYLKNQLKDGEKNWDSISMVNFYKSKMSL